MKNVIITAARKGDWWDVWSKPTGMPTRLPCAGALFRSPALCFDALGALNALPAALPGLREGREVLVRGKFRVQRLDAFKRGLKRAGEVPEECC